MLRHNYIGTEHLLLGLIHEGNGVAAKALESLGVFGADVRDLIREIVGEGVQSPEGHIPFTPRAKQVIHLAVKEAESLVHDYVGTNTSCSDWFARAGVPAVSSSPGAASNSLWCVSG